MTLINKSKLESKRKQQGRKYNKEKRLVPNLNVGQSTQKTKASKDENFFFDKKKMKTLVREGDNQIVLIGFNDYKTTLEE